MDIKKSILLFWKRIVSKASVHRDPDRVRLYLPSAVVLKPSVRPNGTRICMVQYCPTLEKPSHNDKYLYEFYAGRGPRVSRFTSQIPASSTCWWKHDKVWRFWVPEREAISPGWKQVASRTDLAEPPRCILKRSAALPPRPRIRSQYLQSCYRG